MQYFAIATITLVEDSNASVQLSRLESLPLDERGEALIALIDDLEEELNSAGALLREPSSEDGSPGES